MKEGFMFEALTRGGLLNTNSEDLGAYMHENTRDLVACYCSSDDCVRSGNASRRGKLVAMGGLHKTCPKCGSKALYFDTITPKQRDAFRLKQRKERENGENSNNN